jgi:hypothetical protein
LSRRPGSERPKLPRLNRDDLELALLLGVVLALAAVVLVLLWTNY